MSGTGRGKRFEKISEVYRRTVVGRTSSPDARSASSSDSAATESELHLNDRFPCPAQVQDLVEPPFGDSLLLNQPVPGTSRLICGPLRPTETILVETSSSSSERNNSEEEDVVEQIRRINLGLGRGRGRALGRGRGILAISSDESEASFRGGGLGPQLGLRTVSPLTPSPLPYSSLSPSLSSSNSETGSCDGASHESHQRTVIKRGREGRIVPVAANYIWLAVQDHKGIFQYHVDFDPPFENSKLTRMMLKDHVGVLGTIRNFDGAKLFLPFKLQDKVTHLESFNPNDPTMRVKITIKYITPTKSEAYMRDYVQFCNILFRRIMTVLGLVNVNRHFFNTQLETIIQLPRHRLEIWPGYVTAIDEMEGGLMLCCDTSFRVLHTDTMLNIWNDIRYGHQRNGDIDPREQYKSFLAGKIVLTRYNNRHYRIDDVDFTRTPSSTFEYRGQQITFIEYYQRQHGLRISDINQPLLCHLPRPRKNDPRRSRIDPVLLIPELCYITGLSEDLTSNPKIMKDMSMCTRLTPNERNRCLETFIENVHNNSEATKILEDWGLRLEKSSVKLEGRVIGEDLAIELNSNFTFNLKSKNYEFGNETKNKICYDPVQVKEWAVFYPPEEGAKVESMRRIYGEVCRKLGIQVSSGHMVRIQGRRNDDYRRTMGNFLQQHPNLQFFILIMSRRQDDLYGLMKKLSCVDKPIPSQCILAKSLADPRKINTILSKIALQINCKIGGSLWTIRMPRVEKIMFVGMDVYHDPKQKASSVMALVASLNDTHTKYFSKIIRQRTHQETMSSLRPIFVEALQEFYIMSKCWPDRVLVYRDGIGDGELETTRQFEVVQLTESLNRYCCNRPKFTYTVVQKRIHTRIFARNIKNDGYVNPEPGTVLDHTVTRKHFFDFFLVSQLINEGTATPTHYVVLEDNSDISPDLIQKFTFATSFMYYNWAGSIRVPAVCQYAHKLAYLVGQYLQCDPSDQLCKQLYYL